VPSKATKTQPTRCARSIDTQGSLSKLKGVTYLRTDHSGKDTSKGQRGSSAKNDDVDLVWRLTRTDTKAGEGVRLERTHSRSGMGAPRGQDQRVATDDGYDYLRSLMRSIYPDGTLLRTCRNAQSAGIDAGSIHRTMRIALMAKAVSVGMD
jgi:hypothetical protein